MLGGVILALLCALKREDDAGGDGCCGYGVAPLALHSWMVKNQEYTLFDWLSMSFVTERSHAGKGRIDVGAALRC